MFKRFIFEAREEKWKYILSLEAHRKFAKISYTEEEEQKSFANVVPRLWNKSWNLDTRKE